jgi:transcription-repair coupling factor (superfamily II helicase)
VSSISERLSLYTKLDDIKDETELEEFQKTIRDRFGPIPSELEDMVKIVRIRWSAESLGIEKITFKNNNLKFYFVSGENEKYYKSDVFGKIIEYVRLNSRKCILKETKGKLVLTFDKIISIPEIQDILKAIEG